MRGRGACTVVVGVLFAILSFFSRHRRRNKCQPRWVSSIRTHTHMHTDTHTPPSSPHCAQQHSSIFFIQFPLTYQEQPAYQQREPSPSPPSSSLSRHCCCEDEMSVLLKVPLKHNSDLWCLIVSFQSYERRWEHIFIARGYFRAATTDRLYREVLWTTSVRFIIIQTEISEALTNNTSEMTNNANDILMQLGKALHYYPPARYNTFQWQ